MNWQLFPQDHALQNLLSDKLGISDITAQVLINRGIRTKNDAERFISPSLQQLHDPFLMADMDKAADRIVSAIKKNEKIAVYGDYDTDGATSTALLLRFFKMIGIEAGYFIPNRMLDGYGMNKRGVEELKKAGTNLIITVDNGVSAVGPVEYASSLGMDVVVTDHHEPMERLPKCCAVVDPKRSDSKFPFKDLAGVGVVFNLLIALRQRLRECGWFAAAAIAEPRLRDLLDIVAIGTVADVVPLIDENRIFVKYGLEEIKKSANHGINALKIISGLEPHHINATAIAFRLSPRINAAGRMDDPTLGTRLLTTNDPEETAEIAQRLQTLNTQRQAIEAVILKEAQEQIAGSKELQGRMGLALAKEGWHLGVVGIVATRIAEEHKKPCVVISMNGATGRGSVRSIGSYKVLDVLRRCSDLLLGFGGHDHAGGISIEAGKLEAFSKRFDEIISSELSEDDRQESMMVDVELESDHVSEELIDELEMLEPFGEGNPEPTFCLRDMKVHDSKIIKEKHLKLKFSDNMVILDAIGFGMSHHDVAADDILDVAFIPQMDTWRGNGAIQLKLRDLKIL